MNPYSTTHNEKNVKNEKNVVLNGKFKFCRKLIISISIMGDHLQTHTSTFWASQTRFSQLVSSLLAALSLPLSQKTKPLRAQDEVKLEPMG